MRTAFLTLSLTLVSFFALAQESIVTQSSSSSAQSRNPTSPRKTWSADLAMWGYYSAETFVPASWNMIYYGDDLFEVRHNFDQTGALSLYYGHRFKANLGTVDFSFTPALGVTSYDGNSNVGITSHTIFGGEKWKLYTINQYNSSSSPGTQHIMYHWIDFSYHVTDWLLIGASDQYYETGNFSNIDGGPSLGFEFGNFYGKAYAWDVWSESDRSTGIWAGWYFSNED